MFEIGSEVLIKVKVIDKDIRANTRKVLIKSAVCNEVALSINLEQILCAAEYNYAYGCGVRDGSLQIDQAYKSKDDKSEWKEGFKEGFLEGQKLHTI